MTTSHPAVEVHRRLLDVVVPHGLTLDPAGRRLLFLAPTAPGRAAVVHLHPLDGGPAAAQDWPLAGDPALARWTPDGSALWVVSATGETAGEPAHLALHAVDTGARLAGTSLAGAVEDLVVVDETTAVLRVADPGSDRDGMNLGLRVAEPAGPRVDAATGRWRRLVLATRRGDRLEIRPLALPGWTVWDLDVRGGTVAVVASRNPLPAGYYEPSVLVARLADGRLQHVRELHRGTTTAQLARPRLAPDLSAVHVLRGLSIVSGEVVRLDLATGEAAVVPGLDDVTDLGVLDDDRLWFAGWQGTGVQVGTISGAWSAQPRWERWTAPATAYGDIGQPSLAVRPGEDRGYTIWEAPGRPPEVVAVPLAGGDPTPLTAYNQDLIDLAPHVVTETRTWRSPDGTEVEGLVMRPADPADPADSAGPRPVVLLLHGGPTWLWSAAFAPGESNSLALALAAAGAVVLLPNPRGSSGRGQDHARGVIGAMGTVDLEDVLAGVDALAAEGLVDPERAAVMGLSYGGYLTAVCASRTARFRAAVVMSGVGDWFSFATTSAIGGGYERTYQPAADLRTAAGREVLLRASPVYDAAPHPTPTLILHGSADRVTPLAQAEQLHRSWSAAGVPTELVVYPGEGHELTDPAHRHDACVRVVDWLRGSGVLP